METFTYLKVFNGFAVAVTGCEWQYNIYLDGEFICELPEGKDPFSFDESQTVSEMLESDSKAFWADLTKEWTAFFSKED